MKDRDHENDMFNMGEGCAFHGDEAMRNCSLCGIEFCLKCNPGRAICPNCRAEEQDDEDPMDFDEPRFRRKEDEVDRLLREAERLPPEDLRDD